MNMCSMYFWQTKKDAKFGTRKASQCILNLEGSGEGGGELGSESRVCDGPETVGRGFWAADIEERNHPLNLWEGKGLGGASAIL